MAQVGLAPAKVLGFKVSDPTAVFSIGQTVRATILKVDSDARRITLSLNHEVPLEEDQEQYLEVQ